MGNNQAYTDFERTVVKLYNKGVLDKELLSELMEPYRGTDIDEGGMYGTLSKDGLDVQEIVIKVFTGEVPAKPNLPADYKVWTKEQDDQNDAYCDNKHAILKSITDRFGWC